MMGVRHVLQLLLIILNSAISQQATLEQRVTKYPFILVPGDGGSKIEARVHRKHVAHRWCTKDSDWFTLWLDIKSMTPLTLRCTIDNMRLVYDPVTHTTHNVPGVETRISDFSNTSSVEWLTDTHFPHAGYYHQLVSYLVDELRYERNVNVRAAPYDFRKGPNEMGDFVNNLRKLIEETYSINNKTKVVLVGHSMGSLYSLYLFNKQSQAWKDRHIRAFVSLGAPWGGAVGGMWAMASGKFLESPLTCRELQRSMGSTAWLLPYTSYWGSDEVVLFGPNSNYTVHNYSKFFQDINYPIGYLMRQDTAPYLQDMHAPEVEVHCLYGIDVKTPEKLYYGKPIPRWYRPGSRHWFDEQPDAVYGDGDGAVNRRSLEGCRRWSRGQKQTVKLHAISGLSHIKITRDQRIHTYLYSEILTK